MLTKPATRSSRSLSCDSCGKTRAWRGRIEERQQPFEHQQDGQRGQQIRPRQVHGGMQAQRAPGRIQVLEELAVGRNHPAHRLRAPASCDRPAGCDRRSRTPATCRRPARRCAPASASPSPRSRCASRCGGGQDLGALAIGLGADAFGLGAALGAQLVAAGAEALLHALVHRAADLIGQVDALHAHVDQLDAEFLRRIAGAAEHVAGERRALGDDDFLQRAARHHALDAVLDVLAQALRGDIVVAVGGAVVLRGILARATSRRSRRSAPCSRW